MSVWVLYQIIKNMAISCHIQLLTCQNKQDDYFHRKQIMFENLVDLLPSDTHFKHHPCISFEQYITITKSFLNICFIFVFGTFWSG